MIPSAFDYHAPETLDEAIGLLGQYGEQAKVLSGGQSLLPLLKLRLGFTYAPPLRAGGMGTRISVRTSSDCNAVLKSPIKNSSIGMVRSPFDPTTTTSAPSASIVAG